MDKILKAINKNWVYGEEKPSKKLKKLSSLRLINLLWKAGWKGKERIDLIFEYKERDK